MKSCPQTLDKPILLFGIEVEDLAILCGLFGSIALFINPLIAGLMMFGSWFGLIAVKKDKPLGYMVHLIYKLGLPLRGHIPPVKKIKRYCAYSKEQRSSNNDR